MINIDKHVYKYVSSAGDGHKRKPLFFNQQTARETKKFKSLSVRPLLPSSYIFSVPYDAAMRCCDAMRCDVKVVPQ